MKKITPEQQSAAFCLWVHNMTATGEVPGKTAEGLWAALQELHVEVRYDSRSHRPQLKAGSGDWLYASDRLVAFLREQIGERFFYFTSRGPSAVRFGLEVWQQSLNAILAEREVDPFREMLEQLPKWDGELRLNTIFWDGWQVPEEQNQDLLGWASEFLFLGPVQRAFEPGAKMDEMPVLIGDQGIGKSTFLRVILPPEHPEWFADGLHLAADQKERAEALQGRVIVEAAEMAGATRADLESLKAFLSRQDDGAVRLAYRRDAEVLLRRCIIVGTANEAECLPNDPTGLRRFVPVHLGPAHDAIEPWVEQFREQWWSEAVARYRAGQRARLARSLKGYQNIATEKARRQDEVLEVALQKIALDAYFLGNDGRTLGDIAERIGMVDAGSSNRLSSREARRLAHSLKSCGWKKQRKMTDGVRRMTWIPEDYVNRQALIRAEEQEENPW